MAKNLVINTLLSGCTKGISIPLEGKLVDSHLIYFKNALC